MTSYGRPAATRPAAGTPARLAFATGASTDEKSDAWQAAIAQA